MKRKFMAVLLSAALVMSSTAVAFAEDVEGVAASQDVTVNGNVTSAGVIVEGPVTVDVTGNVTNNGSSSGMPDGVNAQVGATVTVGGDVTSDTGTGVVASEGSTVIVEGNVTSSGTGVEAEGAGTIVVEGTITGEDDAVLYTFSEAPSSDDVQILAYKVEGTVSQRTDQGGEQYSDKSDASDLINYIIKKTSEFIGYRSGITSLTVNGTDYDTAKENDVVVVTVGEGYRVSAGTIAVTKNADGTYTLTVPKGGGVTLTAEQIQEAVKETEQQAEQPATQPSFNPEQVAALLKALNALQPAANEPIKEETASNSNPNATASSVVVVPPVYVTADPATIGETAYVAGVTASIANAPYGGTVKLTTGDAAFINRSIIDALETRSDVTLEISVLYGGVPYLIHIPAGFKLRELLGSNGKIDMNKLISMFGVQL
ncbi:hypothetical protein SAMN02910292_01309 [Lachnospiraceae bacterium XBB2008]|nr:hypothetical protein SAMN02910292_01309 [Lachnospiraceae bacterium XBB2008]